VSNRLKAQRAARLASQRLARQRRQHRQRVMWTSTLATAVLLVAA
jgi:hypothetical protein